MSNSRENTVGGDVLHPVAYRAQLTSSTCVPTCIGMLMSFYDVVFPQDQIDEIAGRLGRGSFGGHKATLKLAQSFGFKASMAYIKGKPDDSADQLLATLVREPILVTGRFHHHPELSPTSGHAVVAIGFSADLCEVIYHDPHHRKAELNVGAARRLPLNEFVRRWSVDHHGWMLCLRGRSG